MEAQAQTKAKKPAKKKTKGSYKANSLTPRQWKNIEAKWAADPRIGLEWLAKETGLGSMTLARRKKEFNWVKNSDVEPIDGHEKLHEKKNDLVAKRGRPFIERKDLPEKLKKHFEKSVAYREEMDKNGNIKLVPNMPPNIARFCAENGFSTRSLSNWAYETDENGELVSPDLFQSYQIALAYQEAILIEGGLTSAYSSAITQLMMRNHHHYKPLTDPVVLSGSTKDDEAELDAVYESILIESKAKQEKIKNRYFRITSENNPSEIVDADFSEE